MANSPGPAMANSPGYGTEAKPRFPSTSLTAAWAVGPPASTKSSTTRNPGALVVTRMPSALATPENEELLSAGAMATNATSGRPAATAATPTLYLTRLLALRLTRGIGPPPKVGTSGRNVLQRTSLHYS